MGVRIVLQLVDSRSATEVNEMLRSVGATPLRATHPELGDVFTTVVPDEVDAQDVMERLKQLPAVRHAEVDQFRTTM